MRFSILLPTRNRLDLLSYALTTVIEQSFTDWEVVLSDNASDEDIGAYVRSLADARLRYHRTDSFVSVTENWNEALARSRGDYVLMLGDDDGLLAGSLAELDRLLRAYDEPDLVYTDGLQFAYPDVYENESSGFFQRGFGSFFGKAKEPFFLNPSAARRLVRRSARFRLPFVYNMQHSIISRRQIEELRFAGDFFQSPYPDYYATNALFWRAERILINPRPLVCIGISPKSFGYYYFNRREDDGTRFLNTAAMQPGLKAKLAAKLLPGSAMNTSWLLAMATLRQNLDGPRVVYWRYRLTQLLSAYDSGDPLQLGRVLSELAPWERVAHDAAKRALLATRRLLPREAGGILLEALREWASPYPRYEAMKQSTDCLTMLDVFRALDITDPALERNASKPLALWQRLGGVVRPLTRLLISTLPPLRRMARMLVIALTPGRLVARVETPGDWEPASSGARLEVRLRFGRREHLDVRLRPVDPAMGSGPSFALIPSSRGRYVGTLPEGTRGAYFIEVCDPKTGRIVGASGVNLTGEWLMRFSAMLRRRCVTHGNSDLREGTAPLFSLLTTVFDTDVRFLETLVANIQRQTFGDFEWLVLDNGSSDPAVRAFIAGLPARDRRIQAFRVEENIHIVPGNRYVLERARGEFIVPVDSDDVVYEDALQIVAEQTRAAPDVDLFYSDEHKVDIDATPCLPIFRQPTWSTLTAYATCPAAHLMVFRRQRALAAGVYSEVYAQGSHDWDTALRLAERGAKAVHIPHVLYGWRMHPHSSSQGQASMKPYAVDSQVQNIIASLRRRGLADRFVVKRVLTGYHHAFRITERGPAVALHVVVDGAEDLTRLERNLKRTRYEPLRRLVHYREGAVAEADLLPIFRRAFPARAIAAQPYRDTSEVVGRLATPGCEIIALLNCRIEVIDSMWIWDALGTLELAPEVGIVGGPIFDAVGRILHLGFVGGLGGFFEAPGRGLSPESVLGASAFIRRDVAAVYGGFCVFRSAAAQPGLAPRDLDACGGLHGIEWCLRCRAAGIRTGFTPRMRARCVSDWRSPSSEASAMVAELRARYPEAIAADPYYHLQCSRNPQEYGQLA